MKVVNIIEAVSNYLSTQCNSVSYLLGVSNAHGVTLLGYALCQATAADLQDVLDVLPEPLSFLGAFAKSKDDAVTAAGDLQRSALSGSSYVAVYLDGGQAHAVGVNRDGTLGPQVELKQLASLEEWLKNYRMLRCPLRVRLEVVEEGSMQALQGGQALQLAFGNIVRQLEAPGLSYMTAFGANSRALLRPDAEGSLDSAFSAPPTNTAACPVVHCTALLDTTRLATPPAAPAFSYLPLSPGAAASSGSGAASSSTATCRTTTLALDALCYVRRDCPLGTAAAALTRALVRQVQAAQRVLARQGGRGLPVRAHHFLPPGLSHHLCVLYPSLLDDTELNDARLVAERQRLHGLLGLPANRPLLRPANGVELAEAAAAEEDGGGSGGAAVARLRDVHVGLPTPGIGGTATLLQGSYEYCHYMQDRFNDAGWGCAYRSLQTICSWFRLQKYTSKPIPTHKTIQQILARIGDKPPSFVGSANWIGAIELSYILDEYLGVTSKILTVNRGADIPSHARELAAHFATVGSPVMIGGGVLAYTLLGVRFNEQTGEAAFLILDPHYTGGEDLKKIQQGTWVGWKRLGDNAAAGGPLFVADAFYNFLLPQRPNTV